MVGFSANPVGTTPRTPWSASSAIATTPTFTTLANRTGESGILSLGTVPSAGTSIIYRVTLDGGAAITFPAVATTAPAPAPIQFNLPYSSSCLVEAASGSGTGQTVTVMGAHA